MYLTNIQHQYKTRTKQDFFKKATGLMSQSQKYEVS